MLVNHPSRKAREEYSLSQNIPLQLWGRGKLGRILRERQEVKNYSLQSPEHGILLQTWKKMDLFYIPPSWRRGGTQPLDMVSAVAASSSLLLRRESALHLGRARHGETQMGFH